MDPELAAWLAWLGAAGVRMTVSERLVRDADARGPGAAGDDRMGPFEAGARGPFVEHRDPAAGRRADHATASVVAALEALEPGVRDQVVWDVGCGTGVLAAAAVRCGAAHVVGTDIDAQVLPLARATVAAAGGTLATYAGPDVRGVPAHEATPDLILANLPHKPADCGPWVPVSQAGGPDGCTAHEALVEHALRRLAPDGRIVFFLHSLPSPRLLRTYAERCTLELVRWKLRWIGRGEYGPAAEGFRQRARAGTSLLVRGSGGREGFVAGVWVARRRGA